MKHYAKNSKLAQSLDKHIREGRITLAQAVNLKPTEIAAVRMEAERLRQAGQAGRAGELLRLLVSFDPLDVETWRALATLEQRRGRYESALVCLETVDLLDESTAEDVARRTACTSPSVQRTKLVSAANLQQGARR
ncbi:MAG: hypothetical protein JRH20_26795 [Deltaproteobacteria bacterium]|nr:hypothetical protein [Deltaproteobacteria bacterium]